MQRDTYLVLKKLGNRNLQTEPTPRNRSFQAKVCIYGGWEGEWKSYIAAEEKTSTNVSYVDDYTKGTKINTC